MIKLEDFKQLGFCITWKLINIGFRGSNIFRNELFAEDIINYAITQMDINNDNIDIINLACEYSNNLDKIDEYIKKLSCKEDTEEYIEFRKWRVVYVLKQLPKSNIDFINGLIELGDIWAKFDFPDDSPHIFQGIRNDIDPKDYYTLENYNNLIQKHVEWVKNEINYINNY